MSEPIAKQSKEDVTRTSALRVMCSGPNWGKHPKVYLTMVDDAAGKPSHVVCPYCSHVFEYDAKAKALGGAGSAAH